MSNNDFYGNQQGHGYGAPPGQYQYQAPHQQPTQQGQSGFAPGAAPTYPAQPPYAAPPGEYATSRDFTQYNQTPAPAPYYSSPPPNAYGSPPPGVNSPYSQPPYQGYQDPSGGYQQQLQPYSSQQQPPLQHQYQPPQQGNASEFYSSPSPADREWQNQQHQQQPYQGQDHQNQYVENGAPGDRGLGSTLVGGTAGAFIGKKLGLGKLGGAAAGAVLANVLNHKKK